MLVLGELLPVMQISTAQRAVRTVFTSISALRAATLPSTNGVFNFLNAEMLEQQLEFERSFEIFLGVELLDALLLQTIFVNQRVWCVLYT